MPENYKHIFLSNQAKTEKYTSPSGGGEGNSSPERDRARHSERLINEFEQIWERKREFEQEREAEQIPTRTGTYLSFTSAVNEGLITKSLEDLRKGIRLLNVKEITISEEEKQTRAIIYVPKGKEGHFIRKIEKYRNEVTLKGNPKNLKLVNSIEDVQLALLESFWVGDPESFPRENPQWIEAWLNVNSKDNKEEDQIAVFRDTLEGIGIEFKSNQIIFPERAIILICANRQQLVELMSRSDLLAELRNGQEPAGFWLAESRLDQEEWIEDLLERVVQDLNTNVRVCLLDSGVNNGHPLLEFLIDDNNTLTVEPSWGTNDHYRGSGHGTLMAGISGYDNLEKLLLSDEPINLTHLLCSVKVMPRLNQEQTPRELWGDITSSGVFIAEIQNPRDNMIFCLSVTSSEDAYEGRPSSWSGSIDRLAYGKGENQRLIIVSAGNLNQEEAKRYPDSNYMATIQNPAQSWNSLVIGAFTEKNRVNDPNYRDYSFVAQEGELSPFSSTSDKWENKWPVKPDVVFEGGNLLRSPDNQIVRHPDLELLSTSKATLIKYFDTINATSAATAKASWFAAKIAYNYPEAWPETIRGLMVHSARWNKAMLSQKEVRNGNRGSYLGLIRTFGYGVPNLERALYSRESAFTFISEETIQPFDYKDGSKSQVQTKDMHFYDLPWPKDLLLDLGETEVTLRITLSYFIEPGPGEIGWKDKYRYASYGLRFDLNNIGESVEDFQKRINKEAREEGESYGGNSGADRWVVGTNNRQTGSIHSDFWRGTAAELADCNKIAIYPVIGWWRERHHLGKVDQKTRYSLIISLETPVQDVELYSTVQAIIKTPIETTIKT